MHSFKFNWVKVRGIFFLSILGALSFSCVKQESQTTDFSFTHVDSLTETYLTLQDSMLHTWNVMVKDENEKLQNIDLLLAELLLNDVYNKEQILSLQQRLDQLERIRFNQKSMINQHVVEEYDFASNSLVTEVISFVESNLGFVQNQKLQQMTDLIKLADQRVSNYREEYDKVIILFNVFAEKNSNDLKEIDKNWESIAKPTFSDQEEK